MGNWCAEVKMVVCGFCRDEDGCGERKHMLCACLMRFATFMCVV